MRRPRARVEYGVALHCSVRLNRRHGAGPMQTSDGRCTVATARVPIGQYTRHRVPGSSGHHLVNGGQNMAINGGQNSANWLTSLFRKKQVVHVSVKKGPVGDKTHVAEYKFSSGPTLHTFTFVPRSFRYSNGLAQDVRANLAGAGDVRVQVKVWRNDETRRSPNLENVITWAITIVMLAFVLVLAGLAAATWFASDDLAAMTPVALLTSTAVNGATVAGILLVRISRWGQPFETSKYWPVYTLLPILVVLLINALALMWFAGWPVSLPDLPLWVEQVKPFFAAIGIILTVIAALISGVRSMVHWTILQEVQRQFPAARRLVDSVQGRTVV